LGCYGKGSNRAKTHPAFNDFGLLQIYSIDGTKLTKVDQATVGHWCQGAAWSRHNETVVVECMVEKNLQVFSFDGHSLCLRLTWADAFHRTDWTRAQRDPVICVTARALPRSAS
jgi:hypothetical protein